MELIKWCLKVIEGNMNAQIVRDNLFNSSLKLGIGDFYFFNDFFYDPKHRVQHNEKSKMYIEKYNT